MKKTPLAASQARSRKRPKYLLLDHHILQQPIDLLAVLLRHALDLVVAVPLVALVDLHGIDDSLTVLDLAAQRDVERLIARVDREDVVGDMDRRPFCSRSDKGIVQV